MGTEGQNNNLRPDRKAGTNIAYGETGHVSHADEYPVSGQSGHCPNLLRCLLLTQSGHGSSLMIWYYVTRWSGLSI